jgi:hypothetical protein
MDRGSRSELSDSTLVPVCVIAALRDRSLAFFEFDLFAEQLVSFCPRVTLLVRLLATSIDSAVKLWRRLNRHETDEASARSQARRISVLITRGECRICGALRPESAVTLRATKSFWDQT